MKAHIPVAHGCGLLGGRPARRIARAVGHHAYSERDTSRTSGGDQASGSPRRAQSGRWGCVREHRRRVRKRVKVQSNGQRI